MTIEQIKNTLPLDETGYVFMELYSCAISPEDFAARFEGAELTFESLSTHANATPGWVSQFEAWNGQGII